LAVPAAKAVRILPEAHRRPLEALCGPQSAASPIVSIHLWFEQDFMEHQFFGLVGRRVQWVFKRQRSTPGSRGSLLSTVISAAYDTVGLGTKELVRIALEDLQSVYGPALPKPFHSIVIKEKKATISLTPALESVRPGAQTGVPNLFLAGDWTATGYPATIEGAIISGEKAGDLATG